MALITLAQARKQLNIPDGNTEDDDEIGQVYVPAAAGAVAIHTGEVVDQVDVTEYRRLRNAWSVVLDKVPASELTAVATRDGARTWDVADLELDGAAGIVTVLDGPPLCGHVQLTYKAGYADGAAPGNYQLAALIILQHLWETQRGTQGTIPSMVAGDDAYDPRWSFAIPRRALELLGPPAPVVA